MQPYQRRMSYDSLKSLVPHLQLSQRLQLSFLFRIVHDISRRVSFSVSFLKFHQTYTNLLYTTGVLFVDSVEFTFKWIAGCHVEIRCLNRKRVSKNKDIAYLYFEYFLRSSVQPVRQLELIQCEQKFHNFHDIPIARLKIQSHPKTITSILAFPTGHKMEIVELIDSRVEVLEDEILRADHIKFSAKMEKLEHFQTNLEQISRLVRALDVAGAKTECRIKMNDVELFTRACVMLLSERIEIGSYVIGVFDKTLEIIDLYEDLIKWFHEYSPKVTKMNGKDCVVLRETETITSVAIRDYFDTDTIQGCISFTAINIPKKQKWSHLIFNAAAPPNRPELMMLAHRIAEHPVLLEAILDLGQAFNNILMQLQPQ